MPRKKQTAEGKNDPRTNKMEAVRQALQSSGYEMTPVDIKKYVFDNFGQDMDLNMISSYKSTVREKAGFKSRRRRRGRPKTQAETVVSAAPRPNHHEAVLWKDLRTIKEVASRVGKKNLRELVELLD